MDENPDRETKVIRFGCGALVGLPLGLYSVFNAGVLDSGAIATAGGVLGAVVIGYLSMRYGDRFWERFLER